MKTRASPRFRRRIRVTVGQTPAFTLDIGEGGFATELMRPLAPGTIVQGTVRVADLEGDYEGRVAWARAGDARLGLRGRMGVRFTRLPEPVRKALAAAGLAPAA